MGIIVNTVNILNDRIKTGSFYNINSLGIKKLYHIYDS